jgi:hypothetical protein
MNRVMLMLAVAGSAALAACGGSEIVVQAALEGEQGGDPIPLRDLQIRVLPYDRDLIFDSLRAAHPTPEPEIPAELSALERQITEAQLTWEQAETRWATVRDSLQQLGAAMQRMNRASGDYTLAFRDFTRLEGEEQRLRQSRTRAFEQFTGLQQRYTSQADEVRVSRAQWADEAYEPVDSIILVRVREMRREQVTDTTGASGVARIGVKPGEWWVHARYELPYQELYWNIPVQVTRGEPVQIRLTRENAELRPKL